MTKLTETAYYTRRVIKYGSITLVAMIVGRVILGGLIDLYKKLNPPPPPPPTVGFGTLPALKFPEKDRPGLNYVLETVSGSVETPSDRVNVYFMPVVRPNLLGMERATETAANLGFVFEPEQITKQVYRFSKTDPLPARMDIDIVTGGFTMQVEWSVRKDFLQSKLLPVQTQIMNEIESYLNRGDLLANDIDGGENKITFLQASGKGYKETVSLSEADFVQVDLYREEVEPGIMNLTPKEGEGIIRIIISGSREQGERFVFAKYNYYPVDYDSLETYPIKPGVEAWNELINGGGYIISAPSDKDTVTVREVAIAYYDSFEPQSYFQPVYAFSGDDGFLAIVPAVSSTWVQTE